MVYCIIGKSASGKDSIYKEILQREPSIKKVLLYTTRPMRDGEKEGEEYHFVTKEFLDNNKNKIIEIRKYDTVYGPWYYATLDDGTLNSEQKVLLLGTLESYEKLKQYYGKENIFPIYIEVPEEIRYERALKREESQVQPQIEEMKRRFKADSIDFSDTKINKAGIKKRYSNLEFEKCITEILDDIR